MSPRPAQSHQGDVPKEPIPSLRAGARFEPQAETHQQGRVTPISCGSVVRSTTLAIWLRVCGPVHWQSTDTSGYPEPALHMVLHEVLAGVVRPCRPLSPRSHPITEPVSQQSDIPAQLRYEPHWRQTGLSRLLRRCARVRSASLLVCRCSTAREERYRTPKRKGSP